MNPQGAGGYYSSRDSDLNYMEENTNKIIDLKKAQMKIREMEDCLKSMNEENDSLKGKLGNVISNIGTPQEQNKSDSNINNYNEISRPKVKKKTFSSIINNNTLDDLRQKFKSNTNISSANNINKNNNQLPQQFLSHYKSNSMINNNINENEDIENNQSYEAEDSREDETNDFLINDNSNNNNFNLHNHNLNNLNSFSKNQFDNHNPNVYSMANNTNASAAGKMTKEPNSNMLKWNRNLTLGKSSHNNFNPGSSADVSSNFINEENHFGNMHGSSSNNIDALNVNINHMYKINPFIDNTSTFIHNDYENINYKISNLDQIDNMDNTNNLEEIEQMDNEEEDSEIYGNEFPPLQLRIKNKKKGNKI